MYGSLLWCNVRITSAGAKALHLHNNNITTNNIIIIIIIIIMIMIMMIMVLTIITALINKDQLSSIVTVNGTGYQYPFLFYIKCINCLK